MIIRTLPWPPKELSPNARVHWFTKARATKAYKRDCYLLMAPYGPIRGYTDEFIITCNPPGHQRRDWDNMVASLKAAIDAISLATGVDDSVLKYTVMTGDQIEGGSVVVAFAE